MFGFGKKEKKPPAQETSEEGLFARLKSRLSKTRSHLSDGLGRLLLGKKQIDDELLEELETLLLTADVGVEATRDIIDDLTARSKRKELTDPAALVAALKQQLQQLLQQDNAGMRQPDPGKPLLLLMVGINGAGKTTTIGKLAKKFQQQGKSVMLAAGDTFRAAAVEQLQSWGERNRVPVIAQHTGADSASVIFDALQAASSRNIDILIADTAGRLHTKDNLMEELAKISRVVKKIDPEAPHETMLVVDAGTGQNALAQALQFNKSVGLNSITLSKLDGTAKGGIVFAISKQLNLPIRYIGVGESVDDLREFNAEEYIEALFADTLPEADEAPV
ncbi:MAG: signal recognition particle-docking protein FtsY [gamma proteobacterium symbiont of Bathyaustriella thionipta]|nr:signal recognition particle-docking protein FtsY [gamma proteobacterium symbiont of Bathyaustriella thionipta]